MLNDLYREVILQHYQSPRNRRPLDNPDLEGSAQNPLCGDEITIFASVAEGLLADVAFQARGCSISQASADIMADALRGKTLPEALGAISEFEHLMQDDEPGDVEHPEDLQALRSVRRFPVRVKCALLPWVTLGEAIDRYRADQ